ncbi:MAG: type IV pili twitching motility protein PilT [Zetaproteobacteria bacterium CG2_30_46_52]|nr:MAG: type IV pili twitching motility protein PilT [Zetaproteobacteria bacterium CG2_30_46_52]
MEIKDNISVLHLLKVMVEKDASDLYLMAGAPPGFRVSGSLKRAGNQILDTVSVERIAASLMSEKQKVTFANEMEMNLSTAYPGVGRFRVNIYRQRNSIGLVIRQIKTEIASIDDLGLPDIFKDISMSTRGLVLMVGGTGSGKSTSLAAMIDWRNSNQAGHIITIEDPIEYMHKHKMCFVSQREVGTDTTSFHAALKNTLRQAPDVILLGEIRDREVMEHALAFAETGHLAMATLHANNANQAVERIINFFPEEAHPQVYMNLSLNLRAIMSQRLVKTVDGGRAVVIEVLMNTPRIADLILKGDLGGIKEAMEAGEQYGMVTFDQALLKLWHDGVIDEVEALRNSDSPNNLRFKMKMTKLEGSENINKKDAAEQILQAGGDGVSGGSTLEI